MNGVLKVVPPDGPEAMREDMLALLDKLRAAVESGELTALVTVEVRDGHPDGPGPYRVAYSRSNLYPAHAFWAVSLARVQILEEETE
jgi:hypothetical protein